MELDPTVFDELVVLKPTDPELMSEGDMVFLFRRERLCGLEKEELPPAHPVRRKPNAFLAQKYIHTGKQPRCIRVGTFFGKAIFCYTIETRRQLPDLDSPDEVLEKASVASNLAERTRRLVVDEDAIRLAEATHRAFGSVPLLGIDLLRDLATGQLYVLEINAGGNTWHFSSKIGEETRVSIGAARKAGNGAGEEGRLALIEQFGAFGVIARSLVAKTRELAA
jgi:hypothetical protein